MLTSRRLDGKSRALTPTRSMGHWRDSRPVHSVLDVPNPSIRSLLTAHDTTGSASEHHRRVLRDVTVALMNGARRYLFVTCVVVEATEVAAAQAEAGAEAGSGLGAGAAAPDVHADEATRKMAAWKCMRGRITT